MTKLNKESVLTQEYVKQLFDYKDGFLYWKVRKARCLNIGDVAACVTTDGRKTVTIDRVRFYCSRIIFFWHNGYFPEVVDHEDRDCSNDLIDNLRPANYTKNNTNKRALKNCTSKYLGVYLVKRSGKWRSAGTVNHKTYALGSFNTEAEAALKYNKFAVKNYGEFANLNIITL